MPAIRLVEVSDEVRALIIGGMFYETLGVQTSVATHHLELDFAAICSGYANDWSLEAIHVLQESLLPHAQLVAEQVSAQWVMDARRANAAEGMHLEDIVEPTDGVEPGSEPNVVPPKDEQPLLSPVAKNSRCRRAAIICM